MYNELMTAEIASDVLYSVLTPEVCDKLFRQQETHIEKFLYSTVVLTYTRPSLQATFIVNFFNKVCVYRYNYRTLFNVSVTPVNSTAVGASSTNSR